MAGKKPIVKLRVYRGVELNYDAKGNVKNENFLISVEHGTNLWKLTMKNLKLNGYCKVEVESVWQLQSDSTYKEVEDKNAIVKEVKNSFEFEKEVVLTPDQKRIAELEAKLEAFMNGGVKKEVVEEVTENSLEDIRAEYQVVVGKKPFNGWDKETLIEKIKEAK
jgi:hypothetical protein